MGYVYAISDGAGAVKIGWSRNPARRLHEISVCLSSTPTLIGCRPGTPLDEKAAHFHLRAYRIRGEWFRYEGPVKAFVDSLPPRLTVVKNVSPEPHLKRWAIVEKLGGWERFCAVLKDADETPPSNNTLKKWKARGMPYRVRFAVYMKLLSRGVQTEEADYEYANPRHEPAQQAGAA